MNSRSANQFPRNVSRKLRVEVCRQPLSVSKYHVYVMFSFLRGVLKEWSLKLSGVAYNKTDFHAAIFFC